MRIGGVQEIRGDSDRPTTALDFVGIDRARLDAVRARVRHILAPQLLKVVSRAVDSILANVLETRVQAAVSDGLNQLLGPMLIQLARC